MEKYIIIEEISHTLKSRIVKAKNKETKEIICLKIISETNTNDGPSKETLMEILVLMNFNHDYIISFKSVFSYKLSIVIEMGYCPSNLQLMISNISKPFTTNQIKKIIKQISEGIKFLHENDIMHRDLKPNNILIDDECNIKLCDFGSSRIDVNDQSKTISVGTKWYKAPEILLGMKTYNKKCDIWSLGCILAELFILEPVFYGGTDIEVFNRIVKFFGFSKKDEQFFEMSLKVNIKEKEMRIEEILDECSKESIDLISKMLVVNPNDRFSIEDVLNHEFLKDSQEYVFTHLPL